MPLSLFVTDAATQQIFDAALDEYVREQKAARPVWGCPSHGVDGCNGHGTCEKGQTACKCSKDKLGGVCYSGRACSTFNYEVRYVSTISVLAIENHYSNGHQTWGQPYNSCTREVKDVPAQPGFIALKPNFSGCIGWQCRLRHNGSIQACCNYGTTHSTCSDWTSSPNVVYVDSCGGCPRQGLMRLWCNSSMSGPVDE
jgi:hypothetical protein